MIVSFIDKINPIYRGYAAILGGFLLQFTMGAFYSFGNMSTYMTSYMRSNGSTPNMTNEEFVVVQSTWGMTQGFVMPLSGFIIKAIGEKTSMVLGSLIFSGGCALTYFTIGKELWMVAATYGFVSAFGQNIALIPTLTIGMKWFPKKKGLAMGIVVGGFGGGSFVFNYIQTAILNPDNVGVARSGPNKGYFVDPGLLSRVPDLLLILAAIYLGLGMIASLLITHPPADWLTRIAKEQGGADDNVTQDYVTPCEAFSRKELYLLWVTRLSVVMVTQVIAAFYKTFGQTFINDDKFLALVGAITAVFNCSGRVVYGTIMDKTSYKVAMCIESTLLIILMCTFYLTSMIGVDDTCPEDLLLFGAENVTTPLGTALDVAYNSTITTTAAPCVPTTSTLTKAVYALWVWAIFLTFPGTYSTQPAVTVKTFGHKYGGFIYAFLFSSDIVNNLLVATLSKTIHESLGYGGLFPIVGACASIALVATLFYPRNPQPGPRPTETYCAYPVLAKVGLVEIPEDNESVKSKQNEIA